MSWGGSVEHSNSQTSEDVNSEQDTKLNFDGTVKTSLDTALANTDYGKDAAWKDAGKSAEWAMKQSLQLGAPGISSNSKAAGGYNSTTTDMLGNDLTARAMGVGQNVILDTIAKYSQANSNNINANVNAVNATTGRTTTANSSKATGASSTSGKAEGKLSVICSQLHKDGHISSLVYLADNRYVVKHFCAATQNGYRFWAVPLVVAMRKHPRIYSIVAYFGIRWSLHCASYYNKTIAPNMVGRVLIWVAVPICYIIGKLVAPVPYMHLWKKG